MSETALVVKILQMRLEIHMQPLDTMFFRRFSRAFYQLGSDSASSEFLVNGRIQNKCVLRAVPRDINKAD
jgi:hypothetical protein